MALAIEAPEHSGFLPAHLQQFLKQRLLEALGLGLIGVAAAMTIALATYDALDPSAAMASGRQPANWLGAPGAAAADAAFRLIGLAAIAAPLAAACWGLRFCLHRAPSLLWLRIAMLPFGAILAAAALSAVPPFPDWPLAEGLGGALGASAQNNVWSVLVKIEPNMGAMGAALAAGATALVILAWSAAPPLGPIWRAIAWTGRAFAWVMRLGVGAGARARERARERRAAAADEVQEAEFEDEDIAQSEAYAPEPYIDVEPEPEAPALTGPAADPEDAPTHVARRGLGALVPRRPKPKPPAARKEPTAPKAPKTPKKKARKKAKPKAEEPRRAKSGRQPDLPLDDGFQLPPLDLLQDTPGDAERESDAVLDDKARMLESVLEDFGVKGEIKNFRQGPVVTLFELEPAPGVKASRVIGLADDLARNMRAISVRVATVPGKNVIGVETLNRLRETVFLRELLAAKEYRNAGSLPMALGKDIAGAPIVVDLARMPHLLIAGTTGSGKSVAINAMILSLLYAMTPEQCRFIMVDPKMLELSVYDDIPHLLTPVVTDPRKAVVALKWAVREMENRYRAMSTLGVRNIRGYNEKVAEAVRRGKPMTRRVQTGFDEDGKPIIEEQHLDMRTLPYIVIVVDEMADLMLVAGKDIEAAIQRLAQMARAAGIHLIMATQRPSVDVITGTIKANFPTRISFQVTSKIDSRTILGEAGAEQLLGQGDMLYMAGGGRIQRAHGPFVSDEEVAAVTDFLRDMGEPDYVDSVTEDDDIAAGIPGFAGESGDDLYDQAVGIVLRERKASTSFLQRHLKIGYNRAASLIDRMEAEGVISGANHVGKREVLVPAAGDLK